MLFLWQVGLGVGRTQHSAPVEDGAVGRKGISVERTFAALSSPADLEAKVFQTFQLQNLDTLTLGMLTASDQGSGN